jgi:tripartite-type tricarboxylate transporter receptor subunit TctC
MRHCSGGIRALLCAAAVLLAAAPAAAQEYPAKQIRIVVPLAPGGISDNVARMLSAKLTDFGRQPVIVENRPGANSILGAEAVLKSPADGYTLFMGGSGPFAIQPNLTPKLPYSIRDFVPIVHIGTWANLLVVHPSVPVKSLKELIALAKSQPGKLSYASQGNGSTGHITAEQFKQLTGTDIVHIPYKGAAPASQDLIGGQVHFMFDSVMVSMPHVRAGKLRALGITLAERNTVAAADVPTMAEAGLAGIEGGAWFGLFAPAGSPRAAVDWLNRETRRAFSDPDMRNRLLAQGASLGLGSPESFSAWIASEHERWGRVIRAAGIKVE